MGVAGTGVGSLVDISCCSSASMWAISGFELKTKTVYNKLAGALVRKNIAMAPCQSSARTRASFEGDINRKGGRMIVLGTSEVHPHRGESVRDVASSQYVDFMVLRTASHAAMPEMKLRGNVQAINALIKKSHLYRALAGILTYAATKWCAIFGQTAAWVFGNTNALSSRVRAAAALKFRLLIPALQCSDNMARKDAQQEGADIAYEPKLARAVPDADVVTADSWHLTGNLTNLDALHNYQVDEFLIALAKHGRMLLHCMPAYVARKVGRAALHGPSSYTAKEAGNKLRIQKALPARRFGLLS